MSRSRPQRPGHKRLGPGHKRLGPGHKRLGSGHKRPGHKRLGLGHKRPGHKRLGPGHKRPGHKRLGPGHNCLGHKCPFTTPTMYIVREEGRIACQDMEHQIKMEMKKELELLRNEILKVIVHAYGTTKKIQIQFLLVLIKFL